ncbi:bifunctional aminotransferase class I/II-fold pyridoxal phosphate-dependent enzyme/GNAT family N-acetyltransferase [Gramella jeungdoensis]|uniref:Bifunctional aminotransferase class I/II-fold pyridoxal phosphate-dependent enzyme/GNAT family N-acetyltransferase n=1 Tax=Gramella jeungdoensis TaxID=708091 RepID=A0ABT0Z3J2_9FLAO|nr:bifunctional aminotransferase class I/II-fold pyridoxal phosphate-dependent enzyme/GNAT family N-acetyltransferase [Gramella jeungdoensis]MCM8570302.1 bifunctional aminotransferase class I/II-fold pyridoxal phosphate-dependent enzyme/GNAT family N-acetyltransferase [Gramella jeungdoensis]
MAKIKHNNFLDTVDEVITNATKAGVLHLHAEGTELTGRKITVNGIKSYHFGTTGYLGLEQDDRLKKAAIEAIKRYGTQFPLSKTYISHPLYARLEKKLEKIYKNPILITKNSTLGHIAVIPTAVEDNDAVILDHQVHWSVQNAAQLLKIRGIPVSLIRHNSLEMLEDRIKKLSDKVRRIWYMADGVYSMYGDYAPVRELISLSQKYPQLHLYFDDVHGMSWKGPNGSGYIMSMLDDLPENVLLFGTLSKTFGASGAVLVCPDKKLYRKIKNFGGPLTFSAQLEPSAVAAAIASANIHLSQEIYHLQNTLHERINYFNILLQKTNLPLIENNDSPVFYIGTGLPATGYAFVKKLMNEGFFVNLGLFPAVPVKNTGVRITVSRHNELEDIKNLVEAMDYHFPKTLEETDNSLSRIGKAFNIDINNGSEKVNSSAELSVTYTETIQEIEESYWSRLIGHHTILDWKGLQFLEKSFGNHQSKEHRWSFHYFIITDQKSIPVLATFMTGALWKNDMLSPASVSKDIEEKRKSNPYKLTSNVLSMGCLFTEGTHWYLNEEHPLAKQAIKRFILEIESLSERLDTKMTVLRDFIKEPWLSELFHQEGFIPIEMPDSCIIDDLSWENKKEFQERLSSRSRKHFRKEVLPFEDKFEISILSTPTPDKIQYYYQLYKNVKANNLGLNTFTYPESLFENMVSHTAWEFIELKLKQTNQVVGIMFCYKNDRGVYVPSLVGMDYDYSREFHVYRQLLYQTIKRARDLKMKRIDLGFSASFEKRKLGASIISKQAYIQSNDNYLLEQLDMMRNE